MVQIAATAQQAGVSPVSELQKTPKKFGVVSRGDTDDNQMEIPTGPDELEQIHDLAEKAKSDIGKISDRIIQEGMQNLDLAAAWAKNGATGISPRAEREERERLWEQGCLVPHYGPDDIPQFD